MHIFSNDAERLNDNTSDIIDIAIHNKSSKIIIFFIWDDNLFCRMNRIEKKTFAEKWKSLKNEVKFTIVKRLLIINSFFKFLGKNKCLKWKGHIRKIRGCKHNV